MVLFKMGGLVRLGVVQWVFMLLLETGFVAQLKAESSCELDLEKTLKTLLTQDQPSIQVRALRRELLKKLIEELEEEDEQNLKRSLASLASGNNLPYKRNLASLAKGGYIRTLPDPDDNDNNFKRSLANLAKNGQLPTRSNESQGKRGIESLARNGELYSQSKSMQDLLEDLYGKRNIGSLARNFELPSYQGKRSLSSLAKSGDLNFQRYQRNIGSVVREGKLKGKREVHDDFGSTSSYNKQTHNEDKSLSPLTSTKSQKGPRNKRQTDYYFLNDEYPAPVYQSQNPFDYDDLEQDMGDVYEGQDKRFLGSVARSGWFQPSSSSRYSRFASPDKRHIGSLARLGWLPSFRHIRRFNRSGRSANSDDICREVASDGGSSEIDPDAEDAPLATEGSNRYLSRPLDQVFLRNVFYHPRSH